MDLITLKNLEKTYYLGEIDVPVLKGVSLTIAKGEMVALMGASGSGKTTLMNILGCLDHPTGGEYWLDGQEISSLTPNERAVVRTDKLGFVFQSFNLLARTTALNNVIMPLDYSLRRPTPHEAIAQAKALLRRVDLGNRLDHEPSQMSGGQQQRVAISRSLVNNPAILLADEPTGNLDSHTSVEILRMFQELNEEGITVILVTHDSKVASYAHRTIRITDGLIEDDGKSANGTSRIILPKSAFESSHASPRKSNGDGAAALSRSAESQAVATVECVPASTSSTALAVAKSDAAPQIVAKTTLVESCEEDEVIPAWKLAAATHLPPTLLTALNALRRNKMRSVLTTLGVIIGVSAVIAMTEIGAGSSAMLQSTIATMGANTLMIQAGSARTGGVSMGAETAITLSPQDCDEIMKQCPAIAAAASVVRMRGSVVYNGRNCTPMNLMGSSPMYLEVRDWTNMDEGEMFNDGDVKNANKVCVIGATVKKNLFDEDESPVGKDIRIANVTFRVVGVLAKKGANMMGWDQDDIIIAPWTTVKFRVSVSSMNTMNLSAAAAAADAVNTIENLYPAADSLYPSQSTTETANTPQIVRFVNVDQIFAKAISAEHVSIAVDQVSELLRERHRCPKSGDDDDFNIRDMAELSRMLSSTTNVMSGLLLIVALISLVVGGVGIMNIMLVSVTERTREIGLRMAVGARSYHILRQFLVEAVVLCLFGGAIGVVVGRIASIVVRYFMQWPTAISIPAIVASVAVSASVGVIFGFYPAWKASRLDPIEALRYE